MLPHIPRGVEEWLCLSSSMAPCWQVGGLTCCIHHFLWLGNTCTWLKLNPSALQWPHGAIDVFQQQHCSASPMDTINAPTLVGLHGHTIHQQHAVRRRVYFHQRERKFLAPMHHPARGRHRGDCGESVEKGQASAFSQGLPWQRRQQARGRSLTRETGSCFSRSLDAPWPPLSGTQQNTLVRSCRSRQGQEGCAACLRKVKP